MHLKVTSQADLWVSATTYLTPTLLFPITNDETIHLIVQANIVGSGLDSCLYYPSPHSLYQQIQYLTSKTFLKSPFHFYCFCLNLSLNQLLPE
jgi:hypothetical protein